MQLFGIAPIFGLFLLSNNADERGHGQRGRSHKMRPSRRLLTATSDTTTSNVAVAAAATDSSKKYEKLLEWLASQPGAEISDKIALKPSAVSAGNGYGAFVTEPVEPNELLFAVPRAACITLDNALQDERCGELFRKLVKDAGPGGNTVAMAGFIGKERLQSLKDKATEEQDDNDDSSSSAFGPYLDTLPWERGVNNQEHILYWTDEEVESKLKGSQCYGEALDLRKEVSLAIRVLDSIIGKTDSSNDNDGGTFLFPWQKQQEPQKPVEGLPDAVTAAFVCLLTRAFQDDNNDNNSSNDEEKLVPLLDMLQHSDEPNVSHAMRKQDGTVEVRARQSLDAGQELLNQYRSELEESMPYHRFFTRFGFVPGISEPVENLLADKSSIFFPQKAEV